MYSPFTVVRTFWWCVIAHWPAHSRCSINRIIILLIIINYKNKVLDIHGGVDFGELVIRQVDYLLNSLSSELAVKRTSFRQCDLFPIKQSWLLRKGMSPPSWGTVQESLAREVRRGICCTQGVSCNPFQPWPLMGWPTGRASVPLSLQELVEFYQQNSLKDCFKSLDTCLQFPFKEPERRAISKPPGRGQYQALMSIYNLLPQEGKIASLTHKFTDIIWDVGYSVLWTKKLQHMLKEFFLNDCIWLLKYNIKNYLACVCISCFPYFSLFFKFLTLIHISFCWSASWSFWILIHPEFFLKRGI